MKMFKKKKKETKKKITWITVVCNCSEIHHKILTGSTATLKC